MARGCGGQKECRVGSLESRFLGPEKLLLRQRLAARTLGFSPAIADGRESSGERVLGASGDGLDGLGAHRGGERR